MARTDIIFCGNPGVGKSSIATSISGVQFESGISFGSGLTVELKWNTAPALPNIRFADTPGLEDMELKEKAASAITQALQAGAASGHRTKVIFVVTTEGGRLRPADMYTIKTVMNSIRLADGSEPGANTYSVIINKCDFLDLPSFHAGGKAKIEAMLNNPETNPVASAYVKFLPATPDMAGKNNAKTTFEGLLQWVLMHAPNIQVAEAREIDTSSQEEAMEEMKKSHQEALDKLNAMTKEQAEKLAEATEARKKMEEDLRKELQAVQERAHEQQEALKKEAAAAAAERKKEIDRLEKQQKAQLEQREKDQKKLQQEIKNIEERSRREKREADERAQRAQEEAAAQGGGLMGAFVDLTTIISKPIARVAAGDQSSAQFERDWNKALGQVKKFCLL